MRARSAGADARHPRAQTLASHRVLSAPVLATPTRDADEGAFEGFCDTASILRYVLSRLPPDLLSETECATVDDTGHVMDALTSLALEALQAPVSAVSRKDGDLVYAGFASITLLDIVTAAFVHPFHLQDVSICHRVRNRVHAASRASRSLTRRVSQVSAADVRPDIDAGKSLSSVSARSMTVVAHMDLIRFLHAHVAELGPLASASVTALGLAQPDLFVFYTSGRVCTLRTLVELSEHGLSAAGVVNDDGALVGNLSVSDLRDVPCDKYGLLALPVLEFLAVQAGCRKPRAPITVTPDSTLRDVLERMITEARTGGAAMSRIFLHVDASPLPQDVHHVYVVPVTGLQQPLGVITPTDVLYLFDMSPAEATAA